MVSSDAGRSHVDMVSTERRKQMNADKMVSLDEIRAGLKKAKEAIKKQPGLMKSSVGYLDMVITYVERIATAKDEGKWVASYGTQ
jgi:hypothetical protein